MIRMPRANTLLPSTVVLGLLMASAAPAAVVTTLTAVPNPGVVFNPIDFVAEIQLSDTVAARTFIIESVTDYKFDFGDGTDTGLLNDLGPFPTGAGVNPAFAFEGARHVYPAAGIYMVRFTGLLTYTAAGPAGAVDPTVPVEAETTVTIAEVPEPGALLLMMCGLLCIRAARLLD